MEKPVAGYTITRWNARPGMADELINTYREFAEWLLSVVNDESSFRLVQDPKNPEKFIGLGNWANAENFEMAFAMKEFKLYLSRMTALVTDYQVPTLMQEVVFVKK